MSIRFTVELHLPDELVAHLREEDLAGKAREALIMELLREHRLSQGKAGELLGISRDELFPLMTRYQIPVVDLTPAELRSELDQPFPGA